MEYVREISAFFLGLVAASLFITAPIPEFQEAPFEGSRSAETYIAAVSNNGQGSLGKVNIKITPGDGSLLLNANPFIETDTQISAKTAKQVAEDITGDNLEGKDVTYRFYIDGSFVGGPSAGAAMTIATIAAIENTSVRNDTAITGTIMADGTIGKVGGILEKAEAAGERGLETFYVPEGQATRIYYDREMVEEEIAPGVVRESVEYVPRKFSINQYTQNKYNMSTKEASNVREMYENMLN